MADPLDLEDLKADAQLVKFCPHMDWQINRCTNCRAYRMAKAVEALIEDALTARSELELALHEWEDWKNSAHRNLSRAERAEAESLRLYNACFDMSAAIARVEALCDDAEWGPCIPKPDIRDALRGDQ
jgi:hypothetical protein